jgi:hypothetical protein
MEGITEIAPVRVVGGKVVTASGVGPPALIWLPINGQVVARTPAGKEDSRWLRESVHVRSPEFGDDGRWLLPRACLSRLVTASVDRYGYAVLWRDMSKLSQCTQACLSATGTECDCSCLGLHHGENADGWFEVVGDVVVAELGEKTRASVVYGPRGAVGEAAMYRGELHRREYRSDRKGRKDWPRADRFMCAACLTSRATVWDHCHAHGFVRAPLCAGCNTRYWSGWSVEQGRAAPSLNVDPSYYQWCPGREWHGAWWGRECTA